jgi:hypothetical protein
MFSNCLLSIFSSTKNISTYQQRYGISTTSLSFYGYLIKMKIEKMMEWVGERCDVDESLALSY